jgi:SAM-dependent methyltransferase
MTRERFFDLFIAELKANANLLKYYTFLKSEKAFEYRKAYFMQRLEYLESQIEKNNSVIWDCGCGYGTAAIYLALKGHKVEGSTLEYYFKEIPARIEYWSQFGDVSSFSYNYENAFEKKILPQSLDYIVVGDTLHHLEPLQDILKLFKEALKPDGKLIATDENGNNIFIRAYRYYQRGNKRIIDVYDENLKKNILIGNENVRSFKTWQREFEKAGFVLANKKYIRLFMPFFFGSKNPEKTVKTEQKLWKQVSFLREFFFFGLNFTAQKK